MIINIEKASGFWSAKWTHNYTFCGRGQTPEEAIESLRGFIQNFLKNPPPFIQKFIDPDWIDADFEVKEGSEE